MPKTERIYQKGNSECTIAVLAMMTGCPYTRVKTLAHKYGKKKNERHFAGLNALEQIKVLRGLGFQSDFFTIDGRNRHCLPYKLQGVRASITVAGMDILRPDTPHAVYFDGRHIFDPTPGRGYPKDPSKAFDVAEWAVVLL